MLRVVLIIAVSQMFGFPPACAQATRPAGGYEAPQAVATLIDQRVAEASGIVASRLAPGFFYVNEDSENPAEVYLIDRQGQTRLTLRLTGAQNYDWEDIAVAPAAEPDRFDVCVADIGDNFLRREELVIYRFAEVPPPAQQPATIDVVPTAFRVRYPDRPHDAEAFVVHPITGDAYILTKRADGPAAAFKLRAPWPADQTTTLTRVDDLRVPAGIPLAVMVTGADISPDGRRLVTRAYLGGWEWTLPADRPIREFDRIFGTWPDRLELAPEPQGEAICYSPTGDALLTVSEKLPAVLYECEAAGRERAP